MEDLVNLNTAQAQLLRRLLASEWTRLTEARKAETDPRKRDSIDRDLDAIDAFPRWINLF
jgi:hypothetical protein